MMQKRILYIFLAAATAFSACQQETKKPEPAPVVSKGPVLMDPFKFHKLIEVVPGQDFDIVSWGRGSAQKGGYLILHSDSSGGIYTTTTGDLDGNIIDVYNTDLDVDGNPEIFIQAKGKDTNTYFNMYAFEFTGNKANKLDFPKLTKEERKGYRGDDQFFISEGKLMRKFPVYDGNSKDAKATGLERTLEYGLRNNNFTVKQVGKDSTITNSKYPAAEQKQAQAAPVKTATVTKTGTPEPEKPAAEKAVAEKTEKHHSEKHTSEKHTSKKHHQTEHHKKKKKHRRHHSSDDDN